MNLKVEFWVISVLTIFSSFLINGQNGPNDIIESLTEDGVFTAPNYEFTSDYDEYKSYDNIQGLLYDGLNYNENSTKVFAWYGVPEDYVEGEKLPAVVCAHGGGGDAFETWVKNWTDRGYVAIAMALEGQVPDDNPDWAFSGPSRAGFFSDVDLDLSNQWFYHAVADVILAHSLLIEMPEVDPNNIGLTGISWGGIITNVVTGIDQRFAFSAPIYGCGYLKDSPTYDNQIEALTTVKQEFYFTNWEPSNYIPLNTNPVLFVNGSNDSHFTMNVFTESYEASLSDKFLRVEKDLAHGHGVGWAVQDVYDFADYITKGIEEAPLTYIQEIKNDLELSYSYNYLGTVDEAKLLYTTDTVDWDKNNYEWTELAATIDTNSKEVSVELPYDAVAYFMNIENTVDNSIFSSPMKKVSKYYEWYTYSNSIFNISSSSVINGAYTQNITSPTDETSLVSSFELDSGLYSQIVFGLENPIQDLNDFKLRMNTYANIDDITSLEDPTILVALRNSSLGNTSLITKNNDLSTVQNWEDLLFDFSTEEISEETISEGGLDQIILIFSPQDETSTGVTFYFDRIIATSDQTPPDPNEVQYTWLDYSSECNYETNLTYVNQIGGTFSEEMFFSEDDIVDNDNNYSGIASKFTKIAGEYQFSQISYDFPDSSIDDSTVTINIRALLQPEISNSISLFDNTSRAVRVFLRDIEGDTSQVQISSSVDYFSEVSTWEELSFTINNENLVNYDRMIIMFAQSQTYPLDEFGVEVDQDLNYYIDKITVNEEEVLTTTDYGITPVLDISGSYTINTQSQLTGNSLEVEANSTVTLSPSLQINSVDSNTEDASLWSWSGPNDFVQTGQEISLIVTSSDAGEYIVTFSDICDNSISFTYDISLADTSVIESGASSFVNAEYFEFIPEEDYSSILGETGVVTFSDSYTTSGSYWLTPSETDEEHVFLSHLNYQDEDDNKSWDLRIGQGGQIYSFIGAYGEGIPPQSSEYSKWVDEVWQPVSVNSGLSNRDQRSTYYFIHGAGAYLLDDEFSETFYNPLLASYYEDGELNVMNWGTQAHIANIHKSGILYATRYKHIGEGVLEVTYNLINFGDTVINHINAPWGGVRASNLRGMFVGLNDGTIEQTEANTATEVDTRNIDDTGGYVIFSNSEDALDSTAPSLGIVFGNEIKTTELADNNLTNIYFRLAQVGGDANPRDYSLFTVIPKLNVNPGEVFTYRTFYINGTREFVQEKSIELNSYVNYDILDISVNDSDTVEVAMEDLDGALCSDIALFTEPVNGFVPIFLMENTETGMQYISPDLYYDANSEPFINPYDETDTNYELYQDRVLYKTYDGKINYKKVIGYGLDYNPDETNYTLLDNLINDSSKVVVTDEFSNSIYVKLVDSTFEVSNYVSVNSGAVVQESSDLYEEGDELVFYANYLKDSVDYDTDLAANWTWTGPNDFTATGKTLEISVTSTSVGDYMLTYSDSCNTIEYPFVVSAPTLSNSSFNQESFYVNFYPNPSSGLIYFKTHVHTVKVYNLLGVTLYENLNTSTIDISKLSSGTYFIEFIVDGKKQVSQLIIR